MQQAGGACDAISGPEQQLSRTPLSNSRRLRCEVASGERQGAQHAISGPVQSVLVSPRQVGRGSHTLAKQLPRTLSGGPTIAFCKAPPTVFAWKSSDVHQPEGAESQRLRSINAELSEKLQQECAALAAFKTEEQQAEQEANARFEALERQHTSVLEEWQARLAAESESSKVLVEKLEALQHGLAILDQSYAAGSRESESSKFLTASRLDDKGMQHMPEAEDLFVAVQVSRLQQECAALQRQNSTLTESRAELAEENRRLYVSFVHRQARDKVVGMSQPAMLLSMPFSCDTSTQPALSKVSLDAILQQGSSSTQELQQVVHNVQEILTSARRALTARESLERCTAYQRLRASMNHEWERRPVELDDAMTFTNSTGVDAEAGEADPAKLVQLRSSTNDVCRVETESNAGSFRLVSGAPSGFSEPKHEQSKIATAARSEEHFEVPQWCCSTPPRCTEQVGGASLATLQVAEADMVPASLRAKERLVAGTRAMMAGASRRET